MAKMIDGRELLPPEPLELTLGALDALGDDEELILLIYCQPLPLFNILKRNGYVWRERVLDDGTHEVSIRKG
ncbi:MAG TPA: DUF2249 domain-containing protein [Rhodocyclaceae bacterium]|nr:DUF2249 domain-containing protein [Rhodocyclaceae bacterium]